MRIILIILAILFLVGCEAEPMAIDDPGTKYAPKLQYFKDGKGNCFAIVGIRRTGSMSSGGIGLTYIPQKACPIR